MMKTWTPIDIPFTVPDENEMLEYVLSMSLTKDRQRKLDNGLLLVVGCMYNEHTDWRAATDSYSGPMFDPDTEHLFQSQWSMGIKATSDVSRLGEFYYEPRFQELFPEIPEYIKKLPFKYLTGVFIMLTGLNRPSPPHEDEMPLEGYEYPVVDEPSRYNIALNCFNVAKFFVETHDKTFREYATITPEYPCYAFNNDIRYVLHGADGIDVPRLQLIIIGVHDPEPHNALIKRSMEKFRGHE